MNWIQRYIVRTLSAGFTASATFGLGIVFVLAFFQTPIPVEGIELILKQHDVAAEAIKPTGGILSGESSGEELGKVTGMQIIGMIAGVTLFGFARSLLDDVYTKIAGGEDNTFKYSKSEAVKVAFCDCLKWGIPIYVFTLTGVTWAGVLMIDESQFSATAFWKAFVQLAIVSPILMFYEIGARPMLE